MNCRCFPILPGEYASVGLWSVPHSAFLLAWYFIILKNVYEPKKLGFHDNKVLSLSTSRTRAIFASCGMDKFVRIWNYSEQETEEKHAFIAQQFKEDPLCVSLHPFGHFIAIAFGNW